MKTEVRIRMAQRWWVKPYISLLCIVAVLSGRTPDMDKLVDLIMRRGIRLWVE